jgi:hypothetical protein
MTKNVKIGTALVGGYLLGRTKKAKLAIGFGMFLLGKRLDLDPRQIGRMLADSPVLGSLNDQVRKELVEATRTAATKAITQRADGLADSLHQRAQALGSGTGSDEEPAEDAGKGTRSDDEADRDDADGAQDSGKRKRAPRKSAPRSEAAPRSRSGSTGKSASPARKSTGTARRTASSGTRKARGGDDA